MTKIGEKERQRIALRERSFAVPRGSVPEVQAVRPPKIEVREHVVEDRRFEAAINPKPKKRRAPRGTFDRKAYQREYMRKKRKKERS